MFVMVHFLLLSSSTHSISLALLPLHDLPDCDAMQVKVTLSPATAVTLMASTELQPEQQLN